MTEADYIEADGTQIAGKMERAGQSSSVEDKPYPMRKVKNGGPWARRWDRIAAPFRKIERPLFIWGAGRTGSYLIHDLLSLHPDVSMLRTNNRQAKGIYGSWNYGADQHKNLQRHEFPPVDGANYHITRQVRHTPVDVVVRDPVLMKAIKRSYQRIARKHLVDKSPKYTFYLPIIDALFPDARHVRMLRNPSAIVASYAYRLTGGVMDGYGSGGSPPGWLDAQKLPIMERSRWLVERQLARGDENEAMLGDRCMRVRYEDFVREPTRWMRRILEHAGLSEAPEVLADMPDRFENYNEQTCVRALLLENPPTGMVRVRLSGDPMDEY